MTQLRKEYLINLLSPSNLGDHLEVSNYLTQLSTRLIKNHHYDEVHSEMHVDAKMFLQMIHSKLQHLIRLCQGIEIVPNAEKSIIDPTIHYIISRNIFETVIYFNLQNIFYKEENEKDLVYNLWKLASLKYRQRFNDFIHSTEGLEMMDEERAEIETLTTKIIESKIYGEGDEKTKNQIKSAIKRKNFWIFIDSSHVNSSIGPQFLCNKITNNNRMIKEHYTSFSLFTHPSKETINMFSRIFENKEHIELTGFNLRITNCLVAMFITDYVNLFPETKGTYESMNVENQIICGWYNKMLRGEESFINKAYELLN